MLSFWGILFLFLMLLFSYGLIQQDREEKKLDVLNISLNSSRQDLAKLAARYPNLNFQKISVEGRKYAECNMRFSLYLTAFSNAFVSGISLTNAVINDGGAQVTLIGRALATNNVEKYLDKLQLESNLAGLSFELQDLKYEQNGDPKISTSPVTFTLIAKTADYHE